MDKDYILDNVGSFTAQELANFIKQGKFSFDELVRETEGLLSRNTRVQIEQLLNGSEDEDWRRAQRANTVEAYEAYLLAYPLGKYAAKAHNAIVALESLSDDEGDETMLLPNNVLLIYERINKTNEEELENFIEEYMDSDDPQAKECVEKVKQLIRNLRQYQPISRKELVKRIKLIRTDKNYMDPVKSTKQMLKELLDKKSITKDDIKAIIAEDHNILTPEVIYYLLDEFIITSRDLKRAGVDEHFIEYAKGKHFKGEEFQKPAQLEFIPKTCSEFYFWGIPSSGKSCALGAILSAANNGRVAKTMVKNPCQGYEYMNVLANIFNTDGEVCTLPPGTPTTSTYEMEFDLVDWKDKSHPITCIDLAGELVRCMHKRLARIDLNEEEQAALDTLTRVLVDKRSKNSKYHFFVIEYGAEDRAYEGLPQLTYLESALRYIENTGIFKKDTSGIFLMISKADKIKTDGRNFKEVLQQYIEDNYQSFYEGLKKICRDNEINREGKVSIVPFSLGKVGFADYCIFDETDASRVVQMIMERTKGGGTGKLARFVDSISH